MRTMHTTLLIGPADWDPQRMPKQEFAGRIERLWQACPGAAGAIVFGSPLDHASLAYFTNFTPKLESAIALIPRSGEPRLMVGGGANMLPAAKPLTWIADLVPLLPIGKTVAPWLSGLGGPCVGVDCDNMPTRLHRDFETAPGDASPRDATPEVRALMRRKSERELGCIREACATLEAAVDAMSAAARNKDSVTAVLLAGEHAAIRRGAQDVRTLFSVDGGRSMRPFSVPVAQVADPLHVYVAVRQFGYWADAEVRLGTSTDAAADARQALDAFVATARPGSPIGAAVRANGIGLAADEGAAAALEPGGVFSLRLEKGPAAASAMVAVGPTQVECLWPPR